MSQNKGKEFYVSEFILPFLAYTPVIVTFCIYQFLSSDIYTKYFYLFTIMVPVLVGSVAAIVILRADILAMLRMPGYLINFIISICILEVLPIMLILSHVLDWQYLINVAFIAIVPVLIIWGWLMSFGKIAMNAKSQYRELHSNKLPNRRGFAARLRRVVYIWS